MTGTPRPRPYRIRAILAADREALIRFYGGLAADSLEDRFHCAAHGLAGPAAGYLCGPDHDHREGFVAETTEGDASHIIGHVCIEPSRATEAEMAIAVADAWRRHGVGQALLREAIGWARGHQIRRLVAITRWGNGAMLGLARSTGRPISFGESDGGTVDVQIGIDEPTNSAA